MTLANISFFFWPGLGKTGKIPFMKIPFKKFSGNGNDFVLLDEPSFEVTAKLAEALCSRHFGVGADGVLVLDPFEGTDGKMRIFNADGSEAEMCGNGLRSLVTYLDFKSKVKKPSYKIKTMNALYEVVNQNGRFAIEMSEIKDMNLFDLSFVKGFEKAFYVNTGVPHLVLLTNDVKSLDIKKVGAFYRYHEAFPRGVNVNFVEMRDNSKQELSVRTYERGVEDETYSCGTGLVASAIALREWNKWSGDVKLFTKGGEQFVSLGEKVFYSGEVKFCFEGEFFA